MSILTQTDYTDAKARLREASSAYYAGGEQTMLDGEYDALLRSVAAVESEHPEWAEGDAASEQVASGADVGGDFEHSVPMLSLDNVFSTEEFEGWVRGLERRIPEHPGGFLFVEPKMDGLSIAVHYDDGWPVQIVTRGDGQHGERLGGGLADVLTGLPRRVFMDPDETEPWTGEVRGEVVFSREQFEQANALRVEHGDTPFVNARNGVAGAVRGHASRSYDIPATFIAFDVVDAAALTEAKDETYVSHALLMVTLEDIGFITASSVLTGVPGMGLGEDLDAGSVTNAERIIQIIERCTPEVRASLPYETDGLVIKADRGLDRQAAGFSSRAPRWAIAYKFPEQEASSTLEEVIWQVGRTGVITPRARIAPVFVDGTTITYATLHNPEDMQRKGFMLGDMVAVRRAGKVIPRLEYPLVALRDGSEREIETPQTCPECGGEIDRSQVRWRCAKGRNCRAERGLIYAVSRDALDIEGLGEQQVRALVRSGLVTDVAGMFDVSPEALAGLPGSKTYSDTPANRTAGRVGNPVPLGETMAAKISAEIEKARSQPLARIITALGIQGTGRSMSRRLAAHFGTMQALREASAEEIESVDGIGGIKAGLIRSELDDLAEVIDRLAALGVNMGTATEAEDAGPSEESGSGSALEGMTVVVTGSMVGPLAGKSRNEVNELIESHGGKASGSVSAKTSLLVCGEKAGSKKAKAEGHGVRIVSEDEFAAMLGEV